MIIDAHVHIFPEKIAHAAVEKLAGISGIAPCTDGTLAGTRELMKKSGIDRAVLLNIATKPTQLHGVNTSAIEINRDKELYPLGSIHYAAPDWREYLIMLKEAGIRGIKLHPDYQGFMIYSPQLKDIYAACQEMDIFIVFHAGWDCYSPELVHATPSASALVAREFPRLKMVLAHMGALRMEDEVLKHLVGLDNVYFDTAMAATYMDREKVKMIIDKHGYERIFFGSDCPWEDPVDTLNFIDGLGLKGHQREAILSQNVLELFNK